MAVGALTSDTLKIAILAALHIADELDKANSRYDELNQQIASKSSELAEMLDQAIKTAK
ncbi:MAG: cell division protein ZapA [Acidobacteria bacterium]|nr:cell division protein ZapA [Acidobacteriota bacterium]